MSQRIGIGVSSFRRPREAIAVCRNILQAVAEFSTHDIHTLCAVDEEHPVGYEDVATTFGVMVAPNGGVAANKNRLLRHFVALDCDVVFLIEDDLPPLKAAVERALKSGEIGRQFPQ